MYSRTRSQLLRWLAGEPLSLEEQEISESLKALRTLRYENGRVSVDPEEILDRPGYLLARAAAADLVNGARADQRVIDQTALDELGDLAVRHLLRSLQRGKTFEEAEAVLCEVLRQSIRMVNGIQDAER
ncbi:hypothetical protein [Pseudomonas putida]|uniref:hypothetical protein n=1 Tax=Pseudomonas putida TaxID=303 RepID=UPI00236391B1|nr:hypothetical protein [Pseudomonas putida]MDD1987668.1 hypothetical protein [Pseudomonas putida]HDS1792740.1 hypothetical protein [Pseudomonas putida]